ncbi:MAG TPA: L-threonylcarbamoyladenylate synthase [Spirochaetales bacterium]|nr:L-threonylcarbamoyladenylate synthase [Spirochaetales bacterium]HRY53908.1 L-threonylcarbamoyladenylate synthase [Spirochaetia bacterium]HRZ65302.1 L-threonylcarbamoyladenylate synthase [Spirochaetia bacterium]
MEILEPTAANLALAGARIAAGGLVALPTETVYGLGADAFNAAAVARVFEAKARPSFDPLIVHVASAAGASRVAASIPPKARALMEALWPGPLTLILPKVEELPELVTSGLPSVAIRCPAHPVARAIIEASGTAVAAPSANPFGYLSPTRAEHVARMLGDRVDLIVDGGSCEIGVESTVLDLTREPPRVLRPGGMAREAIEAAIGPIDFPPPGGGPAGGPSPSPGQLDSHYAPRTPLRLAPEGGLGPAFAEALREGRVGRRAAVLLLGEAELARLGSLAGAFAELRLLAPGGGLAEAAASLFSTLHELDGLGLDEIWAERVPERGLGPAINDRLYKASTK